MIDRTGVMDSQVNHSVSAAPVSELVQVLQRMTEGQNKANKPDYKPTLIISSLRTRKDGSQAVLGFYADYKNPVQVQWANEIESTVRQALDEGDNLRIHNIHAKLIDRTKSQYE